MRKTNHTVDFNAHISDLNCDVYVENAVPFIVAKFNNLGYGNINAIKFQVKGYNSFGDIISVDDKETFLILLQDLDISTNSTYNSGIIKLPSNDIRTVELQENQICYTDGTVSSYNGADLHEYDFEELDSTDEKDFEIIEVLKDYEFSAKCLPKDLGDNWICICGQLNKSECKQCVKCIKKKGETFERFSETNIKNHIMHKREINEEQKRQEQLEKEKLQKEKKRGVFKKAGIIALVCILILFIIDASIVSGRKTFNTESEMKVYLNGRWSNDITILGNVVNSDSFTFSEYSVIRSVSDQSDQYVTDITTYHPKRGFVEIGAYKLLLKDGNLVDGNLVYKKNNSYSSSYSSYTTSYESAYSVLDFSNLNVTNNSSYTVCAGTITNNGNNTYRYVEVKGAFKDLRGIVLDTGWTYAVGSEGLAPGESSTFSISVTKNSSITTCSVSILEYN